MKFTYDENCEFCIKNGKEQIHEQEEIKAQIDKLYSEHSELSARYKMTSYSLEKQLKEDKEYKETLRPLYMEYHTKLSKIDEEEIQEEYENWKELKDKVRDIKTQMRLNESKTKSLVKHRDDLEKFKYDKW